MKSVWVFGYGSLIWRPGFDYEASMVGHVRGFERVFYQGNDKHRGTPQRLGRVATMIENESSVVWGRAFLVQLNSDNSRRGNCPLAYLDTRESKEGGYATLTTTFYPRASHQMPLTALVYVALPSNPLYLGPKSYPEMAREIVRSQGECGSNIEYVLNIAEFMRDEVYGVDDEHLFMLEMHIISELANQTEEEQSFQAQLERKHSWCSKLAVCNSRKGSKEDLSVAGTSSGSSSSKYGTTAKNASSGECSEDFVSNVVARKLRCVDI